MRLVRFYRDVIEETPIVYLIVVSLLALLYHSCLGVN